jgi:hypothetical protein
MSQQSTLLMTRCALGAAAVMIAAHTGCGGDDFQASPSHMGGSAGSDAGGADGDSSAGTGGAAGNSGGSAGTGTGGVAGAAGSTSDADAAVLETIHVVDIGGRPVADFDVITSLPDGSLFDSGKTDSQGTVVLDVPEGGSASAVGTTAIASGGGTVNQLYSLSSVLGVVQGSTTTLVAFVLGEPDPGPPMSDIIINVPSGYPSGTTHVDIVMPCNNPNANPTSALTISGFRGCAGDTTYDVILLARDANGTLLGHAAILEKALTPGQGAVLTATFGTEVQSLAASVDGFTSFTGTVNFELDGYRANRPNMKVPDYGYGDAAPSLSDTLSLPGGTLLAKYVFKQEFQWTENTVAHRGGRIDVSASLPASSSFHFPSSVAPVSVVNAPDLAKPKRPRFSWQLGSGTAGSCSLFLAAAQRSANEILFWMASLPQGAATEYQLPDLPSSLADNAPLPGDVIEGYQVFDVSGASSTGECLLGPFGGASGTTEWTGAEWGQLDF